MKKAHSRVRIKCASCGREFTYLPRTDGQPQRDRCYRCKQRAEPFAAQAVLTRKN